MKVSTTRALLASAALAFAGAASADTTSLAVSATVLGVCKFSGAPPMAITSPTLNYLDPTLTTDGSGTSTVSYKCTTTTNPTLSVGGSTSGYSATGTSGLSSGGTTPTYIPFTISWGALAAGAGFLASASTVTLTGTITNANYIGANAGTYSASVPLLITP
ncbi:MAG: hypothetical protein NVS2B4_01680 [Ramlibacter sp.]